MKKEFKLPLGKKLINSYELILTENCNMRCKYCFDDTYSDRTSCNYNYKMELAMIPDILEFIDKTRDENLDFVEVVFFGGEPLLNWDFIVEFIKIAKCKPYKFRYSLNTNLTLLNKEKIDFICENSIGVSVSIDGLKSTNDKTRNYKGGLSSYFDMVKNLPYFIAKSKASKIGLTAMMVINKDTYESIEENYEYLLKIGIPNVNILFAYESDFSEDQLDYIKEKLKHMFIERRLPYYTDLKRRYLNNNFRKGNSHCYSHAYTHATINPRGELFFCHRVVPKMSPISKNVLGNIYEGYNDISDLEGRIGGTDECKSCKAREICYGGCIGCIIDNTDNLGLYNPLCNTIKMLWEVTECIRKYS